MPDITDRWLESVGFTQDPDEPHQFANGPGTELYSLRVWWGGEVPGLVQLAEGGQVVELGRNLTREELLRICEGLRIKVEVANV